MWDSSLPDVSEFLKQGDLLDLQPMPLRNKWTLDDQSFQAFVDVRKAIVLDQCCTVEQSKTVLLAAVGNRGKPKDETHRVLQSLLAVKPEEGGLFSPYEHLLEEKKDVLDPVKGKLWVIKLVERVSLAGSEDDFAELRSRRIARMTIPARAQLRTKLRFHVGRPEQKDAEWLEANGYDEFGVLKS